MEPESPSPSPQVPTTCPYPEPTPSSPLDPPPPQTSWRSILILSSHLCLGLPNGSFLRLPHQQPVHNSILPHTHHMPCQSHLSRFYHPQKIVPCIHQGQNKILFTEVIVTQFCIFLCSFILVLWHVVPNLPQMDAWNVNKYDSVLT
jgi:hypothetical protein